MSVGMEREGEGEKKGENLFKNDFSMFLVLGSFVVVFSIVATFQEGKSSRNDHEQKLTLKTYVSLSPSPSPSSSSIFLPLSLLLGRLWPQNKYSVASAGINVECWNVEE